MSISTIDKFQKTLGFTLEEGIDILLDGYAEQPHPFDIDNMIEHLRDNSGDERYDGKSAEEIIGAMTAKDFYEYELLVYISDDWFGDIFDGDIGYQDLPDDADEEFWRECWGYDGGDTHEVANKAIVELQEEIVSNRACDDVIIQLVENRMEEIRQAQKGVAEDYD